MNRAVGKRGEERIPMIKKLCALVVVGMVCCLSAAPASAAEFPPIFEPVLSLTGDCSTPAPDTVPDPSCPYLPPPEGPSGKFEQALSVAIDAHGSIYVASYGELTGGRIDVFDDEGHFLTELKTPGHPRSVAVDSKGNLYVFENQKGIYRYAPSVYKPELGEIQYSLAGVQITTNPFSGGLAIDVSNDHLYAAEEVKITEYGSAAEGNPALSTVTHPKLGSWSTWAAVDSQRRRLYASYCKNQFRDCGVLVFGADAPYPLLKEIDGSTTPAGKFFSSKGWLSIAVDEETGHFFVDDLEAKKYVVEFDQNYEYASKIEQSAFQGGAALQIAVSNSPSDPTARNHRYLFVPGIDKAGRVFAFAPPEQTTPNVVELSAVNIGEAEAELQARIDSGDSKTVFRIEYVSQEDFEASGWAQVRVAGEGTIPAASEAERVGAIATGLSPGTSYRFRAFAENEIGKDEGGNEASFVTYSDAPTTVGPCPNGSLRMGLSAALPDCRAYELVTPPETSGATPRGVGFGGDFFATVLASPSGDTVSFTLRGGIVPGTEGTGGINGDQYRVSRESTGWVTTGLGPSGTVATAGLPGSTSPDQGFGFWSAAGEGPAVVGGRVTHYVRYPDGRLELVGRGSIGVDPRAQGMLITENGAHIVIQTLTGDPAGPQQLEPNAPPTGTSALYDRTADEVTHVVSLLPGNITPHAGEAASYRGASSDGEGIAFELGDDLYLRVGNAVTYEIGEEVDRVGSVPAVAGISQGGKRIFYLEDEDLLAFDTSSEEVIEFSQSGDVTAVNVAPDGTRAYFVSPSALTAEPNPNGAVAQAGEQNLYLSEEGEISFVGTVTDRDVEGEQTLFGKVDGLGLWVTVRNRERAWDPSRLNPDGSVFLFQSRANLTGYDPGGFPQVYRYDSAASRLHCISCIPTKVPATGGASLQSYAGNEFEPPPFSSLGFVPNLRADGKRAFFESKEALVSYDTNGVQDVYEWEEQGVGSCTRPGGCVYLISSGQSDRDNFLFGHSASGDDVFFTTGEVLTGSDAGGTPSIYDARVGGGFPEPNPEICQGEGCRPALLPAPVITPAAKPSPGASDNVSRRCPKSKRKVKRKGRVVCVKKKQGKKQKKNRKAGKSKGAGK